MYVYGGTPFPSAKLLRSMNKAFLAPPELKLGLHILDLSAVVVRQADVGPRVGSVMQVCGPRNPNASAEGIGKGPVKCLNE